MEAVLFKRNVKAQYWALVDAARRQHPEWTMLKAESWVRNTPQGEALWNRLDDDEKAYLAHVSRGVGLKVTGAGDMQKRVAIRKLESDDPTAPTVREIAEAKLLELQKRHVASGMDPLRAWQRTLTSGEGRDWAGRYAGADANRTGLELAKSVAEDVADLRAHIAAVTTGAPARDLDTAIRQTMQRDGVDYLTAFNAVRADPRHAPLVAKYLSER